MQQFYKNVVDSKVFGYKIEFFSGSRNGVSLLPNALIKSEVYFSIEIIDFNIYREGMGGTFVAFPRLFVAHI